MGRGLGKLQQAILDYLQQRGSEVYVSTVAAVLYHHPADEGDPAPAPRAFEISVRRAIHALAERGLVCCGAVSQYGMGRDFPRLLCWLPEHGTPATDPVMRGADVDRLVLAALEKAAAEDASNWFIYSRLPGLSAEAWPQYSWLTREVVGKLKNHTGDHRLFVDGAPAVAVHRSVKRLAQQRKIRIYHRSYNRIGWVKLNTR